MTNKEFDSTAFGSQDKIVVRQYFHTHTERVVEVDFERRTINGYRAAQIVEHIMIDPDNDNGTEKQE